MNVIRIIYIWSKTNHATLGLMKLSEENKNIWTAEDEATFWSLYRKWERLRSKRRHNKTRVKKFGARTRDTIVIPIEKHMEIAYSAEQKMWNWLTDLSACTVTIETTNKIAKKNCRWCNILSTVFKPRSYRLISRKNYT